MPALTRLVTRGDVETRRIAAVALGQTRSRAALRALDRALDDDDFTVRFNAVWALAEATARPELKVDENKFRDDEARYIDGWKARLADPAMDLR